MYAKPERNLENEYACVPGAAWQAFRELILANAEFSTIATNLAPYMR